MYRLIYVTVAIVMMIGISCRRDYYEYDFGKPVFIKDSVDKDLPQYSEQGFNTFGSYYNSGFWVSVNELYSSPCIARTLGDSLCISFRGAYNREERMDLKLLITGITYKNANELTALDNRRFDLSNSNVVLKINDDTIKNLSGRFIFKRARHLIINNKFTGAVLSGTFEIKGLVLNEPVHFQKGRFDIIIKKQDFYEGSLDF